MIIGEGDLAKLAQEVLKRLDLTLINRQTIATHDANHIGLTNVYNKFLELEKRQTEIENLLKSDKLKYIISSIPTEEQINTFLHRIEKTQIKKLNSYLIEIKKDLETLTQILEY